jgi:hypothetical protein
VKTYKVNHIKENEITISGKGNHPMWKAANSLTDFSSPWDNKPIKKIEFKAIYNSEKVFFLFKVYDSQTHIHSSEDKNDSINNSDRVELFFRTNASLNPYYCLEIDPTSRIMDFKAEPNKQFDFNWNWPSKDLEVKSSIEKTHFIVEGAISIKSLTKFGLLKNGQIETGIYRAKYNQQQNGTYEPTWITWVNPNTETPNFHIATSFGILKLENF